MKNKEKPAGYLPGTPIAFFKRMETHFNNRCDEKGGDEKRKENTHLNTIRGIVIPVDWDEKGNAVAASVSTYDEDQYFIDSKDKGEEWQEIMQQAVEIRGVVREEKNKKIITIKQYRLIIGSNEGLGII